MTIFYVLPRYKFITMSDAVLRKGTLIKRDRMRNVFQFGGEPKWQGKLVVASNLCMPIHYVLVL